MYGIRFRQAETVSLWDDGEETVEKTKRPWLTQWEERLLGELLEEFRPEALGYRFLELRPESLLAIYARPLPIWLYLRTCLAFNRLFWRVLRGLHRRGIIHKKTPPGYAFRWRDLRLGPGREYKR